ncbi:MAG: amidohydrolase family protein [Pseudomonadota bacterium]
MRQLVFLAALLGVALRGVAAPVPAAELAKPPVDARHYLIVSTGGKHGDSWSWTGPNGERMSRESMNLRGQVWEMDMRARAGADGMPTELAVRGATPQGDAAETFEAKGGRGSWRSPVDQGSKDKIGGAFYTSQGGPVDNVAWFVERLLAQPDKTMNLLPAGKARASKLASLDVSGTGGVHQKIDLWSISGIGNAPLPVWADAQGRFFGFSVGIGWLPEAYAGVLDQLEKAQAAALAVQTAALAKSLGTTPSTPVAFVHTRLFDADAQAFLADQTVIVAQGRIVAVGPAASTRVPAGARRIDGRGKTLLPGLWDCHMHVADDFTGLQELSLGVTSIRDPGNRDALTIERRARIGAGTLLSPHVYASSLIDGEGPYAAQVANVATSEESALDLVRKAKAGGFTGVKFYGTFHADWLPAAIAEAHQQGLRVHGHIPVGMRTLDAIGAGYDEVTHINWIMMQAMPDTVINASNGIMRFEGPGRFARDADLDGPALKQIVATMAAKGIYSDPTMVAFEGLYVPENGDLSPAYAPFVGTLPPVAERGFRSGGFAVPKDLSRADYRASWAKMVGLLARMRAAGVPVVAGTDGSGIEIVRELEIYQQAGYTPAQALAAATIVPARMNRVDQQTGSIKVGKTADLVLVQGDPSQRLADLRQTRIVMLDGRLFDADKLREAAGFAGRPKQAR